MKTIIAEKPSVAREIAGLVGASDKKDGYLTGNGYFVTWAFGHLIGLGMPEDYGISGFDKASLPILPNPFLLTVRKVKKDKEYTADTGALKQLKVIEQLFSRSNSIIVISGCTRQKPCRLACRHQRYTGVEHCRRQWYLLARKSANSDVGFDMQTLPRQ